MPPRTATSSAPALATSTMESHSPTQTRKSKRTRSEMEESDADEGVVSTPKGKGKGKAPMASTPRNDTSAGLSSPAARDPHEPSQQTIHDATLARAVVVDRLSGRIVPEKEELVGLDEQYSALMTVLEGTVARGESNSVLLVGERGCGKTATLDRVLQDLHARLRSSPPSPPTAASTNAPAEHLPSKPFLLVRLNGRVHTDDKLAVRDIVRQLDVERDMEGTEFSSLSPLMHHLLSLLRLSDRTTVPVVFVLDELDAFADRPGQRLLYNLLDAVQGEKGNVAVVAIAAGVDVLDKLEKRVKSRFSGRRILFHPPTGMPAFETLARNALTVRVQHRVSAEYAEMYAKRMEALLADPSFKKTLKRLSELSSDPRSVLWAMIPAAAQISPAKPFLEPGAFDGIANPPDVVATEIRCLPPLSLVLLCAAVRMQRRSIPCFNFAMCWDEYRSLVNRASARGSAGAVERWKKSVCLKAWDHLTSREFLQPQGGSLGGLGGANKAPKEHRMYRLAVEADDVERAAGGPGVSADVRTWARE
ncbi:origin recognition complex, subunit 4 [Gonapodya prolifera JEL478]|uniref:Origin recognition complex subunit 4 n=1 Tax=Gonapodya prolifera (strain JEL478) TaxID=1344416 RepID=A0A139AQK3_GONPJ|nr:origin recognition complex, subunit 4 [Gonapodya prolifera JEL478]|eukprot:KXS18783.1 origin recognition complex, subunit 4 [Gonapodya prolifera JEL478]